MAGASRLVAGCIRPPLLSSDDNVILLINMPPRHANTSASTRTARERAGTSVAQLKSEYVLRSAVSGADIACMASAIATTPVFPPLPQSSQERADATVATREAKDNELCLALGSVRKQLLPPS